MIKSNPLLGQPVVQKTRRQLLGHGSALPGEPVSTDSLCQRIEDNFSIPLRRKARVIGARLAVEYRHLCRDFVAAQESPRAGARNPELAAHAISAALSSAQLAVSDLAYIISHTATPAQMLPSGSAEIARLLGYPGPNAELRQACTGFANALQFAFALTAQPGSAPVAIVGVETGSVFFDPYVLQRDPSQWVNFLQMGDGAAAVIIGPDDSDNAASAARISHAYFGQYQNAPSASLKLPYGSDSPTPPPGTLLFAHDFSAVAQHGAALLDAGRTVLSESGFELEQADFIVPHQASGAIAPWLAGYWGIPVDRISQHAKQVGNLGSASIWAALDHRLGSHAVHDRDTTRSAQKKHFSVFLGAEATQYSYGGFVLEQ